MLHKNNLFLLFIKKIDLYSVKVHPSEYIYICVYTVGS